ncbi:MAG TPA: branched-chain amino acid ABC transporter permease [Clostridiales bacterium]|nr:branched-chain amino acid ABC transporter permease [Clostridiales bacterium]
MKRKALKAAFSSTIPVFAGFLFLGASYGFLMNSKGFGTGWVLLISATVFAGSLQFAALELLVSTFNPLYALVLALIINARHLFYGFSMLKEYRGIKKIKPFLIFGLVDETFSIIASKDPGEEIDKPWYYFFVTLLNYIYWVGSCVIGSLLGSIWGAELEGVEFVLTALFIVLLLNQLTEQKKYSSALTGFICTVICLGLFGRDMFLLPAMLLIVSSLLLFKRPIERKWQQ